MNGHIRELNETTADGWRLRADCSGWRRGSALSTLQGHISHCSARRALEHVCNVQRGTRTNWIPGRRYADKATDERTLAQGRYAYAAQIAKSGIQVHQLPNAATQTQLMMRAGCSWQVERTAVHCWSRYVRITVWGLWAHHWTTEKLGNAALTS